MQSRVYKYAFYVSINFHRGMSVSRMSTSDSDDWRAFFTKTVESMVDGNSHYGQLPVEVVYYLFSADGNTVSGTLTYSAFLRKANSL